MANGSAYDILIIGAGAAGLMAAITAGRNARPGSRVALLDGAKKIGAKILVSGGGRCNVTHDVVTPNDYAGSKRNQIAKVLRTFTVDQTVGFFNELGVELKREDTGKLFPTTDKAATVLYALLDAARGAGVDILPDHRVTALAKSDTGFTVTTPHGTMKAEHVIMATGGKSLPKTGSDGYGYELLRRLGHTVTDTTPALVPLVLKKNHWLTELSGIDAPVELKVTFGSGKVLNRQRGAMLATHFGLSGPAPMDISRHWIAAHQEDAGAGLCISFMPDMTFDTLEAKLLEDTRAQGGLSVLSWLHPFLPQRLAKALIEQAGTDPATPLAQLSKDARRALVHALTNLPVPIERDRGYLFAEVTAGGVPLSELNLSTMASRPCPGLFLCGEVLDVDGRIGGYNFQWAWCTGRLAGMNAAIV